MKKPLLPRVHEDILLSLINTITEENLDDAEILKKHQKKLQKNNPVILDFIELWASRTKRPKDFLKLVLGMFIVYRLLESQAEADKMKKDFGG